MSAKLNIETEAAKVQVDLFETLYQQSQQSSVKLSIFIQAIIYWTFFSSNLSPSMPQMKNECNFSGVEAYPFHVGDERKNSIQRIFF